MDSTTSAAAAAAAIAVVFESPARLINTTLSGDTDAGVQTASETETYTDDDDEDSSLDTLSTDEEVSCKDVASTSGVGDDSLVKISPHPCVRRVTRRPPTIFFGTPSKAEQERRDRYKAKVRTRRLLRKDSIELTRRKSGGWEGHTVAETTESLEQGSGLFCDDVDDIDDEESGSAKGRAESQTDLGGERNSLVVSASDPSTLGMEDLRIANDSHSLDYRDTTVQEHEQIASTTANEDDPDATEEADWFGVKKVQQSSEPVSLPSTPVRKKASATLSDAGSSPGIGRALLGTGSNRPSPFFRSRDGRRSFASPSATANSPYVNDENVDLSCGSYYAPSPSMASGVNVLRESTRKANTTPVSMNLTTSLSPLKMDLRQKMAAWAETKVKTAESPEKKEWEQMLDSVGPSVRSPSPSVKRSTQRSALYELAKRVPLPDSPEKQEVIFSSSSQQAGSLLSNLSNKTSTQVPVKKEEDATPSQTRLPRTTKTQITAKILVAPTSRSTNSSSNPSKGHTVPVKRAFSSQINSVNRLSAAKTQHSTFHRSLPTTSSSSLASSSPTLSFVRRAKTAAPATSSSPTKSIRLSAPIVRDARLIASRRQDEEGAVVRTMKATDGEFTSSTEVHSVDKAQEATAAPTAVRVAIVPSAGVGGARRVALASTLQKPTNKAQVREQVRGTWPNVSLDEAGKGSTGNKIMPLRTMRRVNEYVQQSSIPEKAAAVEDKRPLSMAKSVPARDLFRAVPAVPLQRSLHTQQSAASVTTQDYATTQSNQTEIKNERASTERASAGHIHRITSTTVPSNTARVLPLSSAELSKLTSLHTQCNEAGVVQIRLVVVRKHGETRPASPSSKFRKAALVATSANKSERLAREAQDRGTRAAQRSARFSGDSDSGITDDERSFGGGADDSVGADMMPGAFHRAVEHRRGAGDEEPYTSPFRRVSLKKVVRWHRALFVEHGQNSGNVRGTTTRLSHDDARMATQSCLSDSCRALPLDRFGNVAKAGKPLKMSNGKQQMVRVARIVYDDDDVLE